MTEIHCLEASGTKYLGPQRHILEEPLLRVWFMFKKTGIPYTYLVERPSKEVHSLYS